MASYEETLVNISLDAHADLAVDTSPPVADGVNPAGNQYRVVFASGEHECNLFDTTAGQVPLGVLQSKPQVEGQACTVAIHGVSMVEAGAAITAGDVVEPDAEGKVIPTSAGVEIGVALHGAADGELVPVLLRLTNDAAA